jgi:hypothetical protein
VAGSIDHLTRILGRLHTTFVHEVNTPLKVSRIFGGNAKLNATPFVRFVLLSTVQKMSTMEYAHRNHANRSRTTNLDPYLTGQSCRNGLYNASVRHASSIEYCITHVDGLSQQNGNDFCRL